MAILGGPEWNCMVLDRRRDRSLAHLRLYFPAHLVGLLRPAAGACESGERCGCSLFPHRALCFVTCRWIRRYAAAFWWHARTLKFSERRTASARRGSLRRNNR